MISLLTNRTHVLQIDYAPFSRRGRGCTMRMHTRQRARMTNEWKKKEKVDRAGNKKAVSGVRGSTGRGIFKAARRLASLNKTPAVRKRRSTSPTEESEKVADCRASDQAELKCRLIARTC